MVPALPSWPVAQTLPAVPLWPERPFRPAESVSAGAPTAPFAARHVVQLSALRPGNLEAARLPRAAGYLTELLPTETVWL